MNFIPSTYLSESEIERKYEFFISFSFHLSHSIENWVTILVTGFFHLSKSSSFQHFSSLLVCSSWLEAQEVFIVENDEYYLLPGLGIFVSIWITFWLSIFFLVHLYAISRASSCTNNVPIFFASSKSHVPMLLFRGVLGWFGAIVFMKGNVEPSIWETGFASLF